MPVKPAQKKRAQERPRISYAVEATVDRTIREQNRFLEHCMVNKAEVTVFSISGSNFDGFIHAFDRETILFGGRGKHATRRLIRKEFIALVLPRECIELFVEYKGLGTARTKNRRQRYLKAIERMNSQGAEMGDEQTGD